MGGNVSSQRQKKEAGEFSPKVGQTDCLHVALLGDSTLDNRLYTKGGPSVVDHLNQLLSSGTPLESKNNGGADQRQSLPRSATLCAIDGTVIKRIPEQLANVPSKATHLLVSVGGNDGLSSLGIFKNRVTDIHEALKKMHTVQEGFEASYNAMLDRVLKKNLPTAVCLLYNPSFDHFAQYKVEQTAANAGVSMLNDAILRCASQRGLPVLDLRLVIRDKADYANPIEPSDLGGYKIARGVCSVLEQHDFSKPTCVLYR
mmetsp:Transcript_31854/g.62233  ORF Transcript_31854/g.62233 Transcript_31854/m.62233 type:complete len:258 (+) Transcript_31854:3-776(+)